MNADMRSTCCPYACHMADGAGRGRNVTRWTGVEVRALRVDALRRTQEDLAGLTGFSVNTIGKWERRGATITLAGQFAAGMDTLLLRLDDGELQRFWAALADVARIAHDGPIIAKTGIDHVRLPYMDAWKAEDEDVKRREFGSTLAGLSALIMGDPTSLTSTARIGFADAQRLSARVEYFDRQDQRVGGAALVESANRQFVQAKMVLEMSDSGSAGRAFMSATGNMAVIAGWLAFDADNHALARQCYSEALALANAADDDELTVHACLNMAMQSVNLSRRGYGSPHHASRLIGRARDLTHRLPSGRIHALVAAREAVALAALGERAGFARAVATASREMDRADAHEPVADCPVWLRFMSHTEIELHEAIGNGYLGELSKSIELHTNVIRQRSGARNSAHYRAHLAESFARVGDTQSALAEAIPVVTALEGSVSSTRTLRQIGVVRAAVDNHRSADEFNRRFDALTRQVGSSA